MSTESELRAILTRAERVAVVGMSRNPHKAAYRVPACLVAAGFEVVPVNPFAREIMGRRCYASLAEIPGQVDVVVIFRPTAEAFSVVEEALTRHTEQGDVGLIWLQSGIVSAGGREAARLGRVAYVENQCLAVELPRLLPGGRRPAACQLPEEE